MKCRVRDIDINYVTSGEGKPVLIIHGYSCDYKSMYNAMESVSALKDGYKKIYLDLPGMGESDTARWIKNADNMLEVILEFIDKVIPNENFLLAGYSYGGYLSRGVIHKLTERVDGFLAICPVIIPDYKKRELPSEEILIRDPEIERKLKEDNKIDFSSALVIQNEKNYIKLKEEIISGILKADKEFIKKYQSLGYSFSFDVDNKEQKFDKTTSFICGKQDSVVGYKDTERISPKYPRASFHIVDMAGHNLQIEQEEIFVSLVNQWISELDIKKEK